MNARAPLPPTEAAPAPAGLLADIAAGVAAGSDLGSLLERFLAPIVRLAGAQGGAVRVLSEAGDELRLVGALGQVPERTGCHEGAVHSDCGPCGQAAHSQALVSVADLKACAEHSGDAVFFGQACQRLLAVPLQYRGRTLGVYNLYLAGDAEPSAEVQALLRAAGELLGLALNNARLEQERLHATVLQERQWMAAEVHDSLAQTLTFMKLRLPLLHDAMQACDQPRALAYFDELRQAVGQGHASLRSVLTQLRAPMDPRGLWAALASSVEAFRARSGTELEVAHAAPGLKLPPDHEAQVFHIVQEALNNVARHAGAQHAWLRIGPVRAGLLAIVVEDDGAGLPAQAGGASQGSHYGLDIMAERARRLGGQLQVAPRAGGGTCVRLEMPMPAAMQGAA